ncbi:MAG: 4Fe-4S dicluster domain-containing protein [Planctomycetes bacterium]|nr:4Fe-4S dicluster domain-containing protein [Planctomycetota bacterium]
MSMTRREAVRAGALVGAGVAASVTAVLKDRFGPPPADPIGEETRRQLAVLKDVPQRHDEDVLLRMQRELVRAMAKPVEERRWAMVIDIRKCVGCHACTVGCVAENKLPPGVVYRPVTTEESGTFPNVHLRFLPRPCMQCDKPPCVPVCPVKATWKRPDGVVIVNYDKCIGCRYCLTACPYGARTSDFGEYYTDAAAQGAPSGPERPALGSCAPWEDQPNHEYAKSWDRAHHGSPVGNARKCHFCLHRLEVGQLPMCVTTCLGRATYFGDTNDPRALATELIARHNVQVLLPHKNTEPRVFYVV